MVHSRSQARSVALDILFEAEQRGVPVGDVLKNRLGMLRSSEHREGPGGEDAQDSSQLYILPEYSQAIVRGVAEKQAEIDEALQTYSQGWSMERMPNVDRNILRIGTWELVYNDDIPDAVAIDEAVQLARKLSTAESPRFINGLLGRLQDIKTTLL